MKCERCDVLKCFTRRSLCKTKKSEVFVFLSVPPDYTWMMQLHELAFILCVCVVLSLFMWLCSGCLKPFSSSFRLTANCSWVSLLITDTNQLDTLITIKATVVCNCLLITGHFAAFAVSQETCIRLDHSCASSLRFINTFPQSSFNLIYTVYITAPRQSRDSSFKRYLKKNQWSSSRNASWSFWNELHNTLPWTTLKSVILNISCMQDRPRSVL